MAIPVIAWVAISIGVVAFFIWLGKFLNMKNTKRREDIVVSGANVIVQGHVHIDNGSVAKF